MEPSDAPYAPYAKSEHGLIVPDATLDGFDKRPAVEPTGIPGTVTSTGSQPWRKRI